MSAEDILLDLRRWRIKASKNGLHKAPRSTAQQTAYQRTWYDNNRKRWNNYMKRYKRLQKLRKIPH